MEAIIHEVHTGILKHICEIKLIFSNRAKAGGIQTAKELGFPVAVIESRGQNRKELDSQIVDLLHPLNIDYIILAGYMRMISPVLLEKYSGRIINIHPADTRAYQGTKAYEWAFRNNLEKTFITVHYVDEGMDTGEVIDRWPVDLSRANTLEDIKKRGLAVEHKMYSWTLKKIFTQMT